MIGNIWRHKELIVQLSKREILMRYRGSLLGFLWSFITPFLMLAVYAFVFGVVFRARWDQASDSFGEFALILFCGLTIFNIFAEIVNRAASLILANPNYIKRVVFPVEILPVTLFAPALLNGLISLLILVIGYLLVTGKIYLSIIYLPIVILPLLLFTLGLAWFLAATGVYFRDISQLIPIAVSALMFLSPIFYSVKAIPEYLRWLFYLNPLTFAVEDARRVILWGEQPDWFAVICGTAVGLVFAYMGYTWFQKTKKGFVDVI